MQVEFVVGGALLTRDLQESGVSSVHLRAEGTATPRLEIKYSQPRYTDQPGWRVDVAGVATCSPGSMR